MTQTYPLKEKLVAFRQGHDIQEKDQRHLEHVFQRPTFRYLQQMYNAVFSHRHYYEMRYSPQLPGEDAFEVDS